jgi:hypothetical protein
VARASGVGEALEHREAASRSCSFRVGGCTSRLAPIGEGDADSRRCASRAAAASPYSKLCR